MQTQIFLAQLEDAPSATLGLFLLDGASLYAADGTGYGFLREPGIALYSEGLATDNPTNAPDWGDFAMFSDGVIGETYDMQWWMNNSFSPTSYSVVTGALPDGLGLTTPIGNKGRISGTPTVSGTFNFTLRASNSYGTADKAFSITVVAAPGGGAFTYVG